MNMSPKPFIRWFFGVFAIMLAGIADSQTYPARQISFIYPYASGSNADSAWRAIGQELGKRLGQTVVHENRPGAGGKVGLDAVLRATPDGYTVGMVNNGIAVWQPLMEPKFNIEPEKDYIPIIVGIDTFLVLVSRAELPFRDMKGFLAYAKANPGKLNGASNGAGSGGHLGIALLNHLAGTNIVHVPYKGAAPALTALLAGEVDVTLKDAAGKPYIDSGRLIALGVAADRRWRLMPNVPTIGEASGLQNMRVSSWGGVIGPAGMPREFAARLNQALNEVLAGPELRAKLEAAGWVIRGGSIEEFTALIRSDMELFRPVIRQANIKLD